MIDKTLELLKFIANGKPFQPIDSSHLGLEVHYEVRGFSNGGADASEVETGINFRNDEWLPAFGYQSYE